MIFALIAFLIVTVFFISTYVCYRLAFSVPKRSESDLFHVPNNEQYTPHKDTIVSMIEDTLKIPYEDVWITSEDGLKLHGKYYHVSDGAPVMIMFHGYRSAPEKDFCGGLKFAIDSGFNALSVDQRAHGKSEGRCLTFGVRERIDCLDWTKYAVDRFGDGTKIMLYGVSMGAATVLMASDLELPRGVVGIVADCGYSSPSAIIKKVLRDGGQRPIGLFCTLVRLGGILYGGFDTESASACESLKKCKIPVLFVHGDDDRYVPCEMSLENYRACASDKKKLLVVHGAGHALSYLTDRDAYLRALREFTESVLG